MTQDPSHYTYLPSTRGKWLRRGVLLIVFISLAILFLQASRPHFGNAKDNIPWQNNLADALSESKASGKPVLVDFTASWCPPCQEMKHGSWPDPKVEDAVKKNYIPVLLDADDSHAQDTYQKYSVQTIPTILVLDSEGKVLRQADFLPPAELLDFLTKH